METGLEAAQSRWKAFAYEARIVLRNPEDFLGFTP